MKKSDLCFYLSITKEENSAFLTGNNNSPTSQVATTIPDSPHKQPQTHGDEDHPETPDSPKQSKTNDPIYKTESQQIVSNYVAVTGEGSTPQTIQISVDHIEDEERRKSISSSPHQNINLLALPKNADQRSSEYLSSLKQTSSV